MNRFAAAAITSTYYTVIFNFVCRGGADPWAVARTNVSGTVIRLENLVCGCGMCVCTDDLLFEIIDSG